MYIDYLDLSRGAKSNSVRNVRQDAIGRVTATDSKRLGEIIDTTFAQRHPSVMAGASRVEANNSKRATGARETL